MQLLLSTCFQMHFTGANIKSAKLEDYIPNMNLVFAHLRNKCAHLRKILIDKESTELNWLDSKGVCWVLIPSFERFESLRVGGSNPCPVKVYFHLWPKRTWGQHISYKDNGQPYIILDMKIALPSLIRGSWMDRAICSAVLMQHRLLEGAAGIPQPPFPQITPSIQTRSAMSHQSGGPSCVCSAGLLTQSGGTLDKWEARWSEG